MLITNQNKIPNNVYQETALFLLHSIEKGESARDDFFYKYRLQEKLSNSLIKYVDAKKHKKCIIVVIID